MTTYSRADWGARPAKAGPGPLDPGRVEGLALHWPAMSSPLRTVTAVMAALRSWQAYHMDTKGWSDIAYQVAVDQAGNRYELRGLRTQSGANGDDDVNERYGAVLLVLAPGEQPTGAMLAETAAVLDDHCRLFPRSRRVVGHSQIRPGGTTCPGPAVMSLIAAGVFNQSEEDDMPTAEEIADAVWRRPIPMGKDADPIPAQALLRQARVLSAAAKVDPAALAAAIVRAMPAGRVGEATVEAGVLSALRKLVNEE